MRLDNESGIEFQPIPEPKTADALPELSNSQLTDADIKKLAWAQFICDKRVNHRNGDENVPTVEEAERASQAIREVMESSGPAYIGGVSYRAQLAQSRAELVESQDRLKDVIFIYECSNCAWIGNPEHLGQKCKSCCEGTCIRVATSKEGERSIVMFSNIAAKERNRAETAEAELSSLRAAVVRIVKARNDVKLTFPIGYIVALDAAIASPEVQRTLAAAEKEK